VNQDRVQIPAAIVSQPQWSQLVRLDRRFAGIDGLRVPIIRHPRLLVPIDLQALYVPPDGDQELLARVPLALRTDADPATSPFDPGTARPPGVHLHWAMPDALVRGRSVDGKPVFAALPDRWVVLRLLAPVGVAAVRVDGWVVEADVARVVPLASWPDQAESEPTHGTALSTAELTAAAGGSPLWPAFYDASFGRFALHDPLDTLGDPKQISDGSATYLVCGWWSDPSLDPLDVAHTEQSLQDRLAELRWAAASGQTGDRDDRSERARFSTAVTSLGMTVAERYAIPPPTKEVQHAATTAPTEVAFHVASPAAAALLEGAASAYVGEHTWPRSSLLHGMVLGVPVAGPVSADGRPGRDATGVALGLHLDDVAGAFAAEQLASNADDRRVLERTLSAFTGGLIPRIATADGAADLDEYEHGAGFHFRSMGTEGTDWLRIGAGGAGVTAGRQARGRAGGTAPAGPPPVVHGGGGALRAELAFSAIRPSFLLADQMTVADGLRPAVPSGLDEPTSAGVEAVPRAAPRAARALDPHVAIKGAGPSLRHGHDGDASPDAKLRCRWPAQIVTAVQHVVTGEQVLRSLPTSGVPDEVLGLAREAVLLNPYLAPWQADAAAQLGMAERGTALTRTSAEAVLRFGANAVYGVGVAPALAGVETDRSTTYAPTPLVVALHEQLRRRSLLVGIEPDPIAVTSWAQPWVPLLLDWEAEVATNDRIDAWDLAEVDLEPTGDDPAKVTRRVTGRTMVTSGAARRLALAVRDFLNAEDALEAATGGPGQVAQPDEDRLAALATVVDRLDLISVTLQGVRAELLGLGDIPDIEVTAVDGERTPALVTAGTIVLKRLSLVDAFGRLLDVPVDHVVVPEREYVAEQTLRLRPRLNVDARWMLRLVDPGDTTEQPAEACVDQRPDGHPVNPVAGFLLPDHIDEALELFDAAGTPIGQLFHEAVGGGVAWEIAPGRPGPPDAGPLYDLTGSVVALGALAAGVVAADADARSGQALSPGNESALSALLRAIDTTLWSVDPLAAMGTEHIAGLVGRPIAVVAATLRLDLRPDRAQVDPDDADAVAAWHALVTACADRAFPVQLGTLTRADDSLLAFFVDGDFRRAHLVDRAVREAAVEGGRSRGFQSAYGSIPEFPAPDAVTNPYVLADDRVLVRPGQTVRLHLLMHPAGKVHLTSGILPRKSLALAREWTAPGLSVMSPSVRVGPVLLDPAKVRLPKVNALGDTQAWTRRDTPGSWRDDPILAATQSALLPELPHEVQEGYIRVIPGLKDDEGSS